MADTGNPDSGNAAAGKSGGEKSSDIIGAITKGFDQYEYVAIIVPGLALLLGVSIAAPGRLPWTFDKDLTIGAFGIFLIAAYIAGHVLRAIGDVAERYFWRMCGGQPTEWVLNPNDKHQLLSGAQRQKLQTAVQPLLAKTQPTPEIPLSDYQSKLGEWQGVTRSIYAKVSQAGRAGRIDVFNRTLGMMNGVTIAFGLVGVLFAIKSYRAGAFQSQTTLLSALAFIAAAFTLRRFYAFGTYYGRELFVQFLEVQKTADQPLQQGVKSPELDIRIVLHAGKNDIRWAEK